MNYYLDAFKNYCVFNGRATRQQYWMFVLFNMIAAIILSILDGIIGTGTILVGIYNLAVFLPSLGLTIRRLHDIGKSGCWFFISLIPVIGIIWLIVLLCQPSKEAA